MLRNVDYYCKHVYVHLFVYANVSLIRRLLAAA
jgi:hypothetical protein